MSLSIDSSKICIQNEVGTTKFDSTNGLLYRVGYLSNTVTLSNHSVVAHGMNYDPTTDVAIGQYTVTACSGNVGSSFVGNKFPIAVPLLLHVESYAGLKIYGQLTTRPTYLSFALGSQYLFMNNKRMHTQTDNSVNFNEVGAAHVDPAVSVSFTYELSIYRRTY